MCDEDASERYSDEKGNSVRVCERHYFTLVTRQTPGSNTGTSPSIVFDSQIRDGPFSNEHEIDIGQSPGLNLSQ